MAKKRPPHPTLEAGIEPVERRYKDIIDRELSRNTTISCRALGVAVRLLSNAPGFSMTSLDLARERPNGEGRDAIRTALTELEAAGYLVRKRVRLTSGQCVTKTYITDQAQKAPEQQAEPPALGHPAPAPAPENSASAPAPENPASAPAPENPASAPAPEDPASAPAPENPASAPAPEKPAPGNPSTGTSGVKSSKSSTSSSTTTTTPTQAVLTYPPQLSQRQRVVVGRWMRDLDVADRQLLLDELAGAWSSSSPPRNPMGWLRELVNRAHRDEFVPDLEPQVAAERRRREEQEKARRLGHEAREAAHAKQSTPEARRSAEEGLRAVAEALKG